MVQSDKQPLEIGLVYAGRLSARERSLLKLAELNLRVELSRWFPDFTWTVNSSVRRDIGDVRREESSNLLREAADERDTRHWDFVFLFTPNELIPHYRSFAMVALSRPMDAAIISTARLVPHAEGPGMDDEGLPQDVVVNRITTLLLHALGHLTGLKSSSDNRHIMFRPDGTRALDSMIEFTTEEQHDINTILSAIADERLEESNDHIVSSLHFALRATRINRGEILDAVKAARPWEFPLRLSRLTTAAVSTVSLLLLTAESWDLALSQTWAELSIMALSVLLLTTLFVAFKQRLLLNRKRHMKEQLVVTRAAALLIVLCGLAVTWLGMFLLALLASSALFHTDVISAWAASSHFEPGDINTVIHLEMAMFCGSIGLLIGSLGASFEDQQHFQHIIFVDQEL